MSQICVGANARENEAFKPIYEMHNNRRGFNYSSLNVAEDGTLLLYCFFSNVLTSEEEAFRNKKLSFYSCDIDDSISAISLRGAISSDQILEPIYPDNRIDLISENKTMIMVLVDSATDIIKVVKTVWLPQKVCDVIVNNAHKIVENFITPDEVSKAFVNKICTRSPGQIKKMSKYIGKEVNSVLTRALYSMD